MLGYLGIGGQTLEKKALTHIGITFSLASKNTDFSYFFTTYIMPVARTFIIGKNQYGPSTI